MEEESEPAPASTDPTAQWAEMWRTFAESSKQMADAWSGSMGPFMLGRLMEKPAGFTAAGNEMSEAIEKMAQGPRLADVWDIDRKMALVFGAWMEMRQKLSAYNAVTSTPWNEASKRFVDAMSAMASEGKSIPNWREAFAKWSEISNEELIRNQRTDGFLQAQKELLQAGLKLRNRQDEVAEAASAMFGLPSRKDFDDVTRQLTELRREVRALGRRANAKKQ
jgi:poly[(R)-3-hydroxyalkanoate] polymerase subunit PhaE